MNIKLKAGTIEVVKRMENGAALVRVPIAPTAVVDLSKTASTMDGELEFNASMFAEMVANFDLRGRPVTVGFDGVNSDGHDRDTDGPNAAFVESLGVSKGSLFAVIRLNPFAAMLVLDEQAFQGFSIEASRDVETPTETLAGWVLTGGVFTNNPATPTVFRVAATSETKAAEVRAGFTKFSADRKEGEGGLMPDTKTEEKVTLAFHETKVAEVKDALTAKTAEADSASASLTAAQSENVALTAKVADLSNELDSVKTEKIGLSATADRLKRTEKTQAETIKAQSVELTEVKAKLTDAENANIGEKVTATILAAIDKGVKPAAFGDWEGDPAAWLAANYTNIDAFERQTANLCGAIGATSVVTPKSGHDPKTDGPKEHQVSDEQREINERLGIGAVNYAGAKTAKEAKARALAAKAKE